MTISSGNNRVQYTGNGVTSTFSTGTIVFYEDTDLVVIERVISTGVETVLTLSSEYTVSGGNGAAGSVTLVAGALPATKTITIERSIPYSQTDDYVEGEPILAESLETSLDKAAIRDQQLLDATVRSVKFSSSLPTSLEGKITSAPVDGEILSWSGSTGDIAGVSLGSLNLSGLNIVLTGLTSGEILQYDGSNWVNIDASSLSLPSFSGDNTFSGINTFSGGMNVTSYVAFSGQVSFPDDGELTISSGSITPTGVNHTVDTQSDAASDDLDTIAVPSNGEIVCLQAENGARTVIVKHNTGNIYNPDATDIYLDDEYKSVWLYYQTALSKWVVFSQPQGAKTLGTGYAENVSADSTTTVIPFDNSIPQNTEGKEAVSLVYSRKSASSKLIVEYSGNISANSAAAGVLSLFVDSGADAVDVSLMTIRGADALVGVHGRYEMDSAATGNITFSLRFGSSASTTYLNGNNAISGAVYGGKAKTFIKVTEVL